MSGQVGALVLPVPVASPARIVDPVAVGLADFFRYVIRAAIGPAAAAVNATLSDVLPTANVLTHDPAGYWVRGPFPALYLWPEGDSTVRQHSTVYDVRERRLRLFYVLTEAVGPDGQKLWSGLATAVDAALVRASARGYEPAYSYGTSLAGTPIAQSLGPLGAVGWEYQGGRPDLAVPVPSASAQAGGPGEGAITRAYPVLFGSVLVRERVLADTGIYSVTPDMSVEIVTNETGDLADPLAFLEGVLPESDGSDQLGPP